MSKSSFLLDRSFRSELSELEQLPPFLEEVENTFTLSDDVKARLMLVLSEALTNAILHGNKLDSEKLARVKVWTENNEKLCVKVEDEGSGFDPAKLPDPLKEDNLLKPSGRGVYLMREYADSVAYNDRGNILQISFSLNDSANES
jgi:serine/threonine-protein kinase RsbW